MMKWSHQSGIAQRNFIHTTLNERILDECNAITKEEKKLQSKEVTKKSLQSEKKIKALEMEKAVR